jgi:phage baseplate assembly protein V
MIGQIWTRLQLVIAQGVGTLIGAEVVQCHVLDDETLSNVKRVEPYGFSYRPKAGCQTYLMFPSGDRAHGIAIVIGDKRYQMTLVEGEVAIHDDEENFVHIQRGGTIYVKAATEVIADTPLFRTTQDAEVGGNLVVNGRTISNGGLEVIGESLINGKNVSDSHTHTSSTPGSPTSGVN